MAGKVLKFRDEEDEEEGALERAEQANYETEIVRQLDALQEMVENEREAVLGKNWSMDIERLYNLSEAFSPVPSFRPRILVPELQIDTLHEASDLSDLSPIPYIIRQGKDERDEEREKAFVANWKRSNYNLELLRATIWSQFSGTSYLQVSFDPNADNGMGRVVVTARDPATVFRDPYAMRDEDARFVIFEDSVYVDDVRRQFPENGWRVLYHRPGAPEPSTHRMTLPQGPMSVRPAGSVGDAASRPFASADSRVRRRTCYTEDYSIRKATEEERQAADSGGMPNPEWVPVYPNGRLIVECEGVVLFDGGNPIPLKIKPVVSVYGMPPLMNAFAPPPMKYTLDLQELAERMLTQVYENAVRINNAVVYIDEGTGIDPEEFGGVPGECHVITSGSKPPESTWPNAMPQHMMELPKSLLERAEKLRGMTPSRKGITQAGNISAPMQDSALLQSQSLTRLRSRFLADSFQRLSEIVFVFMARFYRSERTFPVFQYQKYEPVLWREVDTEDLDEYIIQIDENSIRPYSQTALRGMVPVMKQLGIIDPETAMELLDIPNKEQTIQRLKDQAQQAAQMDQAKQQHKEATKAASKGKK
jgi:hypothetical protein